MKKDSSLLRHYVVLSGPVGYIYHWCLLEIHLHKAGKVPHSKIFKRDELFLDLDSVGGIYTASEVKRAIKLVAEGKVPCVLPPATDRGVLALPGPAPVAAPLVDATVDGKPLRRVSVKSSPKLAHALLPGDAPKQRTVGLGGPLRDDVSSERFWAQTLKEHGQGWFCILPAGEYKIGDEVDFDKISHVHLGKFGIFRATLGEDGVAVRCVPEELATYLRSARIRISGHPPSRFDGVDDVYIDPEAAPLV